MGNKLPITRERATEILRSFPQAESDWNHYIETEAIMGALADKFGEDRDYWGMVGLLHDVDWGITKDNWEEHCVKAEEILKNEGFCDEFIKDVQSHAYGYDKIPAFADKQRNKKIHHALVASETLTGIIYAYALMRGKNISTMEVSGLKKKFKDKAFAQNCNRDLVREIEKTGLTLDEFFAISIEAVKNIKDEIGLE
jgi:uncharacterized protein